MLPTHDNMIKQKEKKNLYNKICPYIAGMAMTYISPKYKKCRSVYNITSTVFEIKGALCTRCAHFGSRVHRF